MRRAAKIFTGVLAAALLAISAVASAAQADVTPGTITGHVTAPDGSPVPATVTVEAMSGSPQSTSVTAAADGGFSVSGLAAGSWRLSISHPDYGLQYYQSSEKPLYATPVVVQSGLTTTVNPQYVPRGSIEAVILDKWTENPVANTCPTLSMPGEFTASTCTAADGSVRLDGVPPGVIEGRWSLKGYTLTPGLYDSGSVLPGETVQITLRRLPVGSIELSVRPNPDGSIPRTCVSAVPMDFAPRYFGVAPVMFYYCNLAADGSYQATFVAGPLPAGRVQLFAKSDGWGAQWVGPSGGTGDRRLAAQITVVQDTTATAPLIKPDPAGSIAGVVRSKATGAAITATVRPFAGAPGLDTVCSNIDTLTDCGTSYKIVGLGPYAWPLEFFADGYATTWSGGAANRYAATMIQVTAGQTAQYDISLKAEAKLTLDRGASGAEFWSASAYNATTGDPIGTAWYGAGSVVTGLNSEAVTLVYDDYATLDEQDCWFVGTSIRPQIRQIKPFLGKTYNVSLQMGSTCRAGATAPPSRRVITTR